MRQGLIIAEGLATATWAKRALGFPQAMEGVHWVTNEKENGKENIHQQLAESDDPATQTPHARNYPGNGA